MTSTAANTYYTYTMTSFVTSVPFLLFFFQYALGQLNPMSPTIAYNITEKQAPQTIVGNLASDIGVSMSPSGGNSAPIVLINNNNKNRQLFRIDSSGLLRTSVSINRDVICPGMPKCLVSLEVAVYPNPGTSNAELRRVNVQVSIVDLNDCVPTFQSASAKVTHHLFETTPLGVLFLLPTATDDDSPVNGVVDYQLRPPSDVFGVNKTKVVLTSDGNGPSIFDVRLVLKRPLNRQRQDSYLFDLVATDGGSPPLSGSVQIEILVDAPVDPLSPRFDSGIYRVSVNDSAPPGDAITRVRAVPSPTALNSGTGSTGAIRYSFSSRSRTVYGQFFTINSTSGEVTLTSAGGRALADSIYNLSVEATDAAHPNSVPGITALVITVRHTNGRPPAISVDPMTNSGRPEVNADSPPGTFVAFLTVIDPDRGLNGLVSCSVMSDSNGRAFNLTELFDSYFKLVTATTLHVGVYQLTVTCRDYGTPSLSTQIGLNVTVIDTNVPLFSQKTYAAEIVIDGDRGDFVIRVSANRSVATNTTFIKYSLDSNDRFFIDPNTGVVRASTSFRSSHVTHVYPLQVTARDVRNVSSVAVVNVKVKSPLEVTYLDRELNCNVSPSSVADTLLCTLGDIDLRLSTGNALYFSVVNAAGLSNGSDVLRVDSETGNVRLVNSIDAESNGVRYQLTVKVELGTVPVQFIYVRVNVDVKAPVTAGLVRFTFPTASNNSASVATDLWTPSDVINTTVVTVVSAERDDVGPIDYSLVPNDTDVMTHFVMSRDSGELRIKDGTIGASIINRTFTMFVSAFLPDHPDQPAVVATLNVRIGLPPTSPQVSAVGAPSPVAGRSQLTVILAAALASISVFVLLLIIAVVCACRACRRRRMAKSKRKSDDETSWVRVLSEPTDANEKSVNSSPSSSIEGATTSMMIGSTDMYLLHTQNNGPTANGSSPSGLGEHSGDDDSGCAGFSNSTSSDDGHESKRLSNTSDVVCGSNVDLMAPLTASDPPSSARVLNNYSSLYPTTVPDWLKTSTRRPLEVILTPPPHDAAASISRRSGSTCSRKSVRFAAGDDDQPDSADLKKRVHFATDRNQYLNPLNNTHSSDVTSYAGSDTSGRGVDVNGGDGFGDVASKMSYTNSDCSSGLYIVNRPNNYRVGGTSSNRQPIVAFRTFLPPDGSLV